MPQRKFIYNLNSAPVSIKRMGPTGGNAYGVIDDLTLTYNGGQLTRVDDADGNLLSRTEYNFSRPTFGLPMSMALSPKKRRLHLRAILRLAGE